VTKESDFFHMSIVPENAFEKQCAKCERYFPAGRQFFYSHPSTKDKLRPECKECFKSAMQRKRDAHSSPKPIVPDGYKQCFTCKRVKLANHEFFYVASHAKDGLEYQCKECSHNYYKSHYIPKKIRPFVHEGYKICIMCNRELLATPAHFHASSVTKDKMRNECRECRSREAKASRSLYPEIRSKEHDINKKWYIEHKAQKAEYKERNKERIRHYQQCYRKENRERRRKYYQTHIEHNREYGRNYHRQHREHDREQEKLYYQSIRGREMIRAKVHRRRMRRMAIPGTLTHEQILLKLRLQRFRCYYCFKKFERCKGKYTYHLEHTIPISRTEMQPRHDMSHVVLSCPQCNLEKQDKLPSEWPKGNRLL
jgi:hypothetical protein